MKSLDLSIPVDSKLPLPGSVQLQGHCFLDARGLINAEPRGESRIWLVNQTFIKKVPTGGKIEFLKEIAENFHYYYPQKTD